MDEPVLIGLDGRVLTVTLNRPDKLNSFNEAMHAALRDGARPREGDPEMRAVLLTGAGQGLLRRPGFGRPRHGGRRRRSTSAPRSRPAYNPLVRRLRALEKPVVCAVNGVAAGAGANIALACDIVLAARSAPASSRPSAASASSPTPAAPGSCRAWSATRARRGAGPPGRAAAGRAGRGLGLIWKCVDDDAPRWTRRHGGRPAPRGRPDRGPRADQAGA